MNQLKLPETYYANIKDLNIKHYAHEVPYYSVAGPRDAEAAFLDNLPKNALILDVGCGSGRFSINAARMGFKVTGIDITPEAVEACRKRAKQESLKNITFEVMDITEDAPKTTFDYVFCPRFVINAIATKERRNKAIENMQRVLKPAGTIYIESFNILYMGQGPLKPLINVIKAAYRGMAIKAYSITGREYKGLFPGDIIYPANKVENAPDGYAHLPTYSEIKRYLKKGKTASIYEITGQKKKDYLKIFRYSIWITQTIK